MEKVGLTLHQFASHFGWNPLVALACLGITSATTLRAVVSSCGRPRRALPGYIV